jgi:hypothetical protein
MIQTSGRGSFPKSPTPLIVFVSTEFINPQVEVLDDLHGKVEHTRMVDTDITDASQYPSMMIHTFQYCTTLPNGSFQWQWK